jgi:hypothetical protein
MKKRGRKCFSLFPFLSLSLSLYTIRRKRQKRKAKVILST